MFCPMCGAPNEDEAVFCGNCGAALDEEQALIEQAESAEAAEPVVEEVEAAPDEVEELVLENEGEPAPPAPAPPLSPPAPRPQPVPSVVHTSGLAIASLVMGIAGWTLLPVIGSILAIIFGYMARNEIRQRPDEVEGEGLAVAGLVLGWIMVGLSVVLLCLGAVGMCFFFGLVGASGGY
ncbi:MAG: DUF4190 domain-containing protein [Anaerolineae bacterium]